MEDTEDRDRTAVWSGDEVSQKEDDSYSAQVRQVKVVALQDKTKRFVNFPNMWMVHKLLPKPKELMTRQSNTAA